jgi:energy-coupling factor transporter transmembrane protein EcfT
MSDLEQQRFGIDFDVAKSIRYHAYRRSFWDAADNTSKILTVVSGMAVLVSIIGSNNPVAIGFAFVVAVTGAMDVVLGFSARARTHDGLYRAFSRLAN